jgi:bacillithiol system protein YtxJ
VSLKNRTRFLNTPGEVDAFLAEHPRAVLFKAGLCSKTPESFRHLESQMEAREELPLGVIRVVEARAASNRVAEVTGVMHESPQVFLFKEGKAVFDRDNWDITEEDLAAAFKTHFPEVPSH